MGLCLPEKNITPGGARAGGAYGWIWSICADMGFYSGIWPIWVIIKLWPIWDIENYKLYGKI